ncbi:hypothetical protein HDE_10401 [Halotydeus destructor]|nr:hypothetical protein HDE_10401 [Halotydeus destructor]
MKDKLNLPSVVSVPWKTHEELLGVYSSIYGETSDLTQSLELAREQLMVWLIREPTYKNALEFEATALIISAKIADSKLSNNSSQLLSAFDLNSLYSTAVLRFFDLLGFYRMVQAKSRDFIVRTDLRPGNARLNVIDLGFPDILISCRHDAAHNRSPPLTILKEVTDIALEWLGIHFWQKKIYPISEDDSNVSQLIEELSSDPTRARIGQMKNALFKSKRFVIEQIKLHLYKLSSIEKLVIAETEAANAFDDATLTKAQPFLNLFLQSEVLHLFMTGLVNDFNSNDEIKKSHSVAWFLTTLKVLNGRPPKSRVTRRLHLKGEKSASFKINWLKVFRHSLNNPVASTPLIVEYFRNLIPDAMPTKQFDQCKLLAEAFLNSNEKQPDPRLKPSDDFQIKTVDDLKIALSSEA